MLPEQLVSHWAIGDRVPSLALAEAFSRGGERQQLERELFWWIIILLCRVVDSWGEGRGVQSWCTKGAQERVTARSRGRTLGIRGTWSRGSSWRHKLPAARLKQTFADPRDSPYSEVTPCKMVSLSLLSTHFCWTEKSRRSYLLRQTSVCY